MKSSTVFKYVIGIVIAVILLIVFLIMQLFNYENDHGIIVNNEKMDSDRKSELQNFTFSLPEQIYGSDIMFISIRQKYNSRASGSYSSGSGVSANILFFNYQRDYYKILLNEKASINIMDYPDFEKNTLQQNIYYDISLKDTDGNGRINSDDNPEYFISALDGSDLKKIKLEGYKVMRHEFGNDYQSIYLLCAIIPKDKTLDEEYWERALFEYDIRKGALIKHENLNMLLSKAKEIMVK